MRFVRVHVAGGKKQRECHLKKKDASKLARKAVIRERDAPGEIVLQWIGWIVDGRNPRVA